MNTTTLFRPVNKAELDLIQASDWQAFPPRLPGQPIFYPVMNLEYARQITVEWNVPRYGNGFVVAFDLPDDYLKQHQVYNVGNRIHDELWVPAENLPQFNAQIVGDIRVIEAYSSEPNEFYLYLDRVYDLSSIGPILAVDSLGHGMRWISDDHSTVAGISVEKFFHTISADRYNTAPNSFAIKLKDNEDIDQFQAKSIVLLVEA